MFPEKKRFLETTCHLPLDQVPFANPSENILAMSINVCWIEDSKMWIPRCFFCLIPFPVPLAGARLGAADDCSWKPEGAPKHVLLWGRVVGLEIVPEIIMQCFCVACGSAFNS